jgi:8-oxo-dGTP diphosphatase
MPASDQGSPENRYQAVLRTLIFIISGRHVLLIKGAPDKRLWANLYNGLGGHIEKGEDVVSAAYRELAEEAGIKDVHLRICGSIIIGAKYGWGVCIFVLKGEIEKRELLQPIPKLVDEGELKWIDRYLVKNLQTVEDLPVVLERIFSMQPGDPPFSAYYRYDENDKLIITFSE